MELTLQESLKGSSTRFIGSPIRSREAGLFAQGRGNFVDDIKLGNTAYLSILRSPYAYAKVKRVDLSRVLGRAGVITALTEDDLIGKMNPVPEWGKLPIKTHPYYPLSSKIVRYVGEPVAAIVTDARYTAEDVLDLVDVEYEPLRPVVDTETALKAHSPIIYKEWGDNVMLRAKFESGDVDEAFRTADHIIKEKIKIHRHSGAPLEPRAYLANSDSSTVTLWASTQNPHMLRTFIAMTLGIPEGRIRVIQPDVGGAFGIKMPSYPEEALVAYLAMALRRPVNYVESRSEAMIAEQQAREQTHRVEIALTKNGMILGLKDRSIANLGTYFPNCGPLSVIVPLRFLTGLYKIQNYRGEVIGVVTNKAPYGAYRGYGKDAASFIIERMIDIAARELGLDPVEIRVRNLVKAGDMPYKTATGGRLDSGDYVAALGKLLGEVRYNEFRDSQEEWRRSGKYRGIGISAILEPCASYFPNSLLVGFDTSTVRIEPSGTVTILTGVTSPGLSHKTVFSQIVAEVLSLEPEMVEVVQGDTAVCPYGYGSWGSRSSVVGVSSIYEATIQVKQKVLKLGSKLLRCEVEELELVDGKVQSKSDPDRFISLLEIAQVAYGMRRPEIMLENKGFGLEATANFLPENLELKEDSSGKRNAYAAYAYSINGAIVEVDINAGAISILRYVSVSDCGTLLNPKVVESQIHGGIAQGIGGAIFEEMPYNEDGQPLATTFMSYLLPTAVETPSIEVLHIETPSPILPLGAKGIGEGGVEGVAATIANAVEDALAPLGIRVKSLPLTPENVWRMIAERHTN